VRILVITGAGVSAESGIPTFRGKHGYWRNLDPAKLSVLICAEFAGAAVKKLGRSQASSVPLKITSAAAMMRPAARALLAPACLTRWGHSFMI